MGQSNTTTEARIDKAVGELDLLRKSGKDRVRDITDVFRNMDIQIGILKSEKEFLIRQMKRKETNRTNYSSKDRKISMFEADTQTEMDEVMSLSIENETLRSRNNELERTILEQKKQDSVQLKGNILTNLACSAILPATDDDKYIPSAGPRDQVKLAADEYQNMLRDKDIMNAEIQKLGTKLVQEKKENDGYRGKICELESQIYKLKEELQQRKLDKSELSKLTNYNDVLRGTIAKHEDTIKTMKNDMREKIDQMQEQADENYKLKSQIEQTTSCANDAQQQSRINEELKRTLERAETELKQCKDRIDENRDNLIRCEQERDEGKGHVSNLENQIRVKVDMIQQLQDRLTATNKQNETNVDRKDREIQTLQGKIKEQDNKLTAFKLEMENTTKDLKNQLSLEAVNLKNEKTKTNELQQLISRLEEQISDLNMTNNKLETDLEIKETDVIQLRLENEKLVKQNMVKRCISFHSILKQPQSDQAVTGITELLQRELKDIGLDVVEESKRTKNVPLLVVLYNLFRLTDDAKGALNGIEAASDVALVVLHCKEVKKPSDRILTDPEFKKLGIIVDMSFLSAKGIIHNEITSNAISQLNTFINKYQ